MNTAEIAERRRQLQEALVQGAAFDPERSDGARTYITRTDSTNIERLGYHHETSTMVVTFRNGGVYAYQPIAWETFHAIAAAESAGKAFHYHIRKNPNPDFTTTRLDQPVLPKYQPAPSDVITDDDLEDAGLLVVDEASDLTPEQWAAAACQHPSLERGTGRPMQRCPDCHRIVAV